MEQLDMEKVKQILGDLKCEEELSCVKGGSENLCRAEDIGLKSHLVCLEEDRRCRFMLPYRDGLLCKCPVRVTIKTELRK